MKRLFCGILAGLLLCLTGCGAQPEPEQLSLFAMDTYMSLAAYGDGASEALAACGQELNRLDASLSRTREGSEIYTLNRQGRADVSRETADLIADAVALSRTTGGAFDPTVAPLVTLWGITTDSPQVPRQEQIDALLPLVGVDHVTADGTHITLDPGCAMDLGGIAKGSGMIHPNMATMLVFITTDCAISSEMLQKALSSDIAETFNMISIDGDTSTNDMVTVLANGLAGNKEISKEGDDFNEFMKALNTITVWLCRRIAADGEGATKLLECKVSGAKDKETAKTVAKSVVCSSLTKAAMFGSDANWGRVLCAIGYSGADVDVNKIDVWFKSDKGSILVCENGAGVDFSEEKAKEILSENEIDILIDLKSGDASSTAWGCDLTYDYVRINGDYRT